MSNAARRVLLVIGIIVLVISVAMFVYSRLSISNNSDNAIKIANKLNSLMPDKTNSVPSDKVNPSMPIVELNGVDFIGLIEMPTYDVLLPICNKWSASDVMKYPHRFSGSVYDNSLVIGGSDNQGQFDFMKAISVGDTVCVTDVTGGVFTYVVSDIKITDDVSANALNSAEAALIFFARSTYSFDYTVVMCDLK